MSWERYWKAQCTLLLVYPEIHACFLKNGNTRVSHAKTYTYITQLFHKQETWVKLMKPGMTLRKKEISRVSIFHNIAFYQDRVIITTSLYSGLVPVTGFNYNFFFWSSTCRNNGNSDTKNNNCDDDDNHHDFGYNVGHYGCLMHFYIVADWVSSSRHHQFCRCVSVSVQCVYASFVLISSWWSL